MRTITGVAATLLSLMFLSCPPACAEGEFTASDACEAYTSLRKLTNPGAAKLEPGKTYPVLQGNRPQNPEWYLLRMESVSPPNRWVKIACGTLENAPAEPAKPMDKDKKRPDATACTLSNQADSYVFALSWQPAFCENKPDKPECKINDPKVYQATHFTLHGLWPNKSSCGINYGYCGSVKAKPARFCDYPPVPITPKTREDLALVMPSVGSGSCLERHEWYKHGTCQNASADEYYQEATALVHQFNDSGMSQFMSERIGKRVSLQEFAAALDAGLGQGASKRAKLGCKDGMLVDVSLNLPAELPPGANLKALIAQAPEAPADKSCGNGFRVDQIGQQ